VGSGRSSGTPTGSQARADRCNVAVPRLNRAQTVSPQAVARLRTAPRNGVTSRRPPGRLDGDGCVASPVRAAPRSSSPSRCLTWRRPQGDGKPKTQTRARSSTPGVPNEPPASRLHGELEAPNWVDVGERHPHSRPHTEPANSRTWSVTHTVGQPPTATSSRGQLNRQRAAQALCAADRTGSTMAQSYDRNIERGFDLAPESRFGHPLR
jgi:hypothetical protein